MLEMNEVEIEMWLKTFDPHLKHKYRKDLPGEFELIYKNVKLGVLVSPEKGGKWSVDVQQHVRYFNLNIDRLSEIISTELIVARKVLPVSLRKLAAKLNKLIPLPPCLKFTAGPYPTNDYYLTHGGARVISLTDDSKNRLIAITYGVMNGRLHRRDAAPKYIVSKRLWDDKSIYPEFSEEEELIQYLSEIDYYDLYKRVTGQNAATK